MLFIYIIGGCLVFYIFLRAYLKIKLKFWYLQPVFHIYNIGLWLYPRGIINPGLPLVNKYTNLFNIKTYFIMLFPYFVGVCVGIFIGKGNERTNNSYYHHTGKIINLENKLKEYEHLFGKIN